MTQDFIKKQQAMDKHYPEANELMWNYCIFLGKFTDRKGKNYDLGIHDECTIEGKHMYYSAAIVDGPNPGDYFSGGLDRRDADSKDVYDEKYTETIKRARKAGYIIK